MTTTTKGFTVTLHDANLRSLSGQQAWIQHFRGGYWVQVTARRRYHEIYVN